jgi:predicted RNA binding protein YcfA (HicA-like mRNA interferase family)
LNKKWAILIVAGTLLVTGILLSFNVHVRGAAKLALSKSAIVTLSSNNEATTVMARMNEGEGLQAVIAHIESDGWILEDQLGSVFYFTNGEESLVIILKMWTNQYIVAEMTEG